MSGDGSVDEDKRATLRRFAALGAATPFAGNAAAEEEDNDARSAIVGYLSTTPGAHFSKIRDDLQLSNGEAQYHLRELLDDGRIVSEKDGDYRRYFPADEFTAFERRALGVLRRETQRAILLELLSTPGQSGTDLADAVGVSRPAVSNHVSHLEDVGLVGRDDGYRVLDPASVALLVVRFADTLGPDAAAFATDAAGVFSYDP